MIQLSVLYNDNTRMYYPVPEDQGWRMDAARREIVVGKGMPRTIIPLDQVRCYDIEETP